MVVAPAVHFHVDRLAVLSGQQRGVIRVAQLPSVDAPCFSRRVSLMLPLRQDPTRLLRGGERALMIASRPKLRR
jgi:hypothetical protein